MSDIAEMAARDWAITNAVEYADRPEEFGKRVAQVYAACRLELSTAASSIPSSVPDEMQQSTEQVSLLDPGLSGGQAQESLAGAAS